MRFTVDWTLLAGHDLRSLIDYLLSDNPVFVKGLFKKIRQRAASLKSLPHRGRVVPELLESGIDRYREMTIPPYRLIYRIEGRKVFVVGLFDARRNLEDILIDRFISR